MCTSHYSFSFKHESAFIGYQNDTPAAVVFQATNQLKSKGEEAGYFKSWCLIEQARVLGDLQLDGLMEEEENSELWKQTVSKVALYSFFPQVRKLCCSPRYFS